MHHNVNLAKLSTAVSNSLFLFGVFGIIVGSFIAFGILTPQGAVDRSLVLGATSQKALVFSPLTLDSAIVSQSRLTLSNIPRGTTKFNIELTNLKATSYSLPLFQAHNADEIPQSFQISPILSAQQVPVSFSIIVDGIKLPLIQENGEYLIPQVTVDPQAISTIQLEIIATEPIQYPIQLELSITQ